MPTYRDMGKMRGLTNYTTYASPNSKTIFFAKRGNNTHQYILKFIQPHNCFHIAYITFSLICNGGVEAQFRRLINYTYLTLNKYIGISITLEYNIPPSAIFKFALHNLFTSTIRTRRFHNLFSQFQSSFVKFLNILRSLLNIWMHCAQNVSIHHI